KRYDSDFISLQQTPPIDDVKWEVQEGGLGIFLNTHDPTGNAKYFRWTFDETWEYNAAFFSHLMFINHKVAERPQDQYIYTCWRTAPSTGILISSTERLSESTINKFQLTFLPPGNQKVVVRYSIFVQQRALSADAYDYWQQLKKTTENLGGLFDPLPTQVTGNLHGVGANTDPVLGFFSGGTVASKRIFIYNADLPSGLNFRRDIGLCQEDSVAIPDVSRIDSPGVLLISSYGTPSPVGYTYSYEN